jgi:hypothetical protein
VNGGTLEQYSLPAEFDARVTLLLKKSTSRMIDI